MEGREVKKLFTILTVLGVLLVLLVLGMITLVAMLKFQPEILLAEKKESVLLPMSPLPDGEVSNGIHVETGLIVGEGLSVVINNCTNCHSAKLITQNRATKEGWTQVIRWMQETQNLWDLGENEEIIVSYLSTHYAPVQNGRRKPLKVEWYELDK